MSTTFAPATLPEVAKEALCLDLLSEFGADRVSTSHSRGEITFCCPLPWHQESRPSAALNYQKLAYKCLSAETLVKTYDGERPIGELAGGRHRLLDGNGKWVEANVREFGRDRLYRVTLSRNGLKREVYTTLDHRWYVRKKGAYQRGRGVDLIQKTTADLKPKDRIPSVWPMLRVGRTTLSRIGVMAGFVFGDGTSTEHSSVANFCGDKDKALLPYFDGHVVYHYDGVSKITSGLPRSWRSRPSLDEGLSYLYGWLAGYFAADGCVADDGHVTLSCADEETLRFVIAVCDRLGVATYTLGKRDRIGISGTVPAEKATSICNLSFRNSTLAPEFFLIPHHRERFERSLSARKYERTHWWVSSVEETDRYETVYCAEVPTTHSFVLAGNILTGNCLGCGSSGGLLWFIAVMRDIPSGQARKWVENQTGFGDEVDLPALLHLIDQIYESPQRTQLASIPRFSERVLDPWKKIHPYLTDPIEPNNNGGRGIPRANVVRMKVGYAERYQVSREPEQYSERIVIPQFWKGKLAGWQSRRLCDDGTPKYLSTQDFPKDQSIYNYDPDARTALVVESPMSVLKHCHHLPIEGTFGASVTDRQIRLLARHERVILFMDNDKAGWRAVEGYIEGEGRKQKVISIGMVERLQPYCEVLVVQNPYAADPGDMDDETVYELARSAVPYAVWQCPEPEELLEWNPR